jgi:hypothetical protein
MSTQPLAPQPHEKTHASGTPERAPALLSRNSWLLIPTVMGVDAGLTYMSRDLGVILTLAEGATATIIVLILVLTVLYGSDSTCERAFRLLRWIVNRPEPPPGACRGRQTR